jgi:hypothetical protein
MDAAAHAYKAEGTLEAVKQALRVAESTSFRMKIRNSSAMFSTALVGVAGNITGVGI